MIILDQRFIFIRFLQYDSRSTPLRGDLTTMAAVEDPKTDIGDAGAVSEQSGNLDSNVAHVSFENITLTSQHHDDPSASHTKNIENPTSKSVTQPLNASPSNSNMLIRMIEIDHNSPRQGNLTELSDNEKSFEYGFDSDGCRGPFI